MRKGKYAMKYDVIIVGAGPGGIFSAYELSCLRPDLKVAVFEAGHALEKRRCPIDGDKIKIIREALLSNCGVVEISGEIPKDDEYYLKEFYSDKIIFSR